MPAARPYHHGNLKQALLEAAVELIAETGPRGLTLREAARRASVSHNAPYRHFRDRDDLLAAVATDGFDRLTRAMASGGRKASPLNRLRRSGLTYVQFALRWPQHFAVMFDMPWNQPDYPECAAAAERCFGTLLSLVRDCQAAKQMPPDDTERRAYHAWSLVHGIAKLANAGQFPWRSKAEVLRFCAFSMAGPGGPAQDWRSAPLPDSVSSI
ncbi:MAG TPA: TetR/AcrR family transcriptional regulator [Bryobacteraceae bacterium]|nr:TetR/AcrR family transcriptional regulator [Bryobacteraceae bacterium]